MMFTYPNAVLTLSKLGWCFSVLNVMALFAFFVAMYTDKPNQGLSDMFLIAIAIGAIGGLVQGIYIKFRAEFASLCSIVMLSYYIASFEIIFGGGTAAFAVLLGGSSDLRWFAFNTNVGCVVLSLLIGMLLEARRLGLLKSEYRWREEIGKHLNLLKRQVSPTLTTKPSKMNSADIIWLTAGIGVNIPLLFQLYGGGRDYAVFFAAPLLTLTLFYINLKIFGPGFVRIYLLRKIEKENGYRFQNADYEQIQELRRSFFLARWLMKDYRLPIVAAAAAKSNTQTMKKLKYRHKG
jgi:hypothetical protein